MTQVEKIKAEINLQLTNLKTAQEEGFITEFGKGQLECLEELYDFISNLPEEQVSDSLESEIQQYYVDWDEHPMYVQTARHFARWQKKQMLKDAMEYTIIDQNECSTEIASFPPNAGLDKVKEGDKVKLIIVKED